MKSTLHFSCYAIPAEGALHSLSETSTRRLSYLKFYLTFDQLTYEILCLEKCVILRNDSMSSDAEDRGCQRGVRGAEGILILVTCLGQSILSEYF